MYELQQERQLSPLDEMLPAFYYCYLVCFPLKDNTKESTCSLLRSSVSSLQKERPYLAGRIYRDQGSEVRKGHLLLNPPSSIESLQIVFNDLNDPSSGWIETYEDLKAAGMPPHKLDARFLAPLTAGVGETRNVMSIQANFINGGLLLAFCFHHNFADAYGAGRIIARLSEHCNGTVENPDDSIQQSTSTATANSSLPDVLNMNKLKSQYSFKELESSPELWRLNCLEMNGVNDFRWPDFIPSLLPARDPPVISMMFSFSTEALKAIKALAQPREAGAWVSTNDALVAFLWRHVMRARFPWSAGDGDQKEQMSNVVVALDGRKDLSISPTYIGNCLFHCFTELPIGFIGSQNTPLSDIAIKIRQTIANARNPDLLKKVIGLAATHPDCQTIKYANDNLGSDLYTTSWMDLPLYKLDWGPLGRTDFFRIPGRHFESLCCILPPRDGIVELITSMEEGHSKRLCSDAGFLKFAKRR